MWDSPFRQVPRGRRGKRPKPVDSLWWCHILLLADRTGLAGDLRGYTARVEGMRCPIAQDLGSSTEESAPPLMWKNDEQRILPYAVRAELVNLASPPLLPSPDVIFLRR